MVSVKVCYLIRACRRSAIKESFVAQTFESGELFEPTSGGVFRTLASHVIGQGALVRGVVWDEEMSAVYVLAGDTAMVQRVLGLRYVQSLIGGRLCGNRQFAGI